VAKIKVIRNRDGSTTAHQPHPSRVKQLKTLGDRIGDPDARRRFVDLMQQADALSHQATAMRNKAWDLYRDGRVDVFA
jgi:hypothetical protein